MATAACAAPLTHGQTIENLPKGGLQVGLGAGGSLSSSTIELAQVAINQSETLVNQQLDCKQTDRSDCIQLSGLRSVVRTMYAGGLTGFAQPLAELSVKYGLTDRWMVGGRLGSGLQRLDLDYQLGMGGPDRSGWQAQASFSYSRQSAEVPIGKVQALLEKVGMASNNRHNFDFRLSTGRRLGEIGWLTLGGRFLMGRYQVDLRPSVPLLDDLPGVDSGVSNVVVNVLPRTDEVGWSHFTGVYANLLLGWRYLYVGGELSLAYYHASSYVLGYEETWTGLAVVPSLLVLTRF